MRNKRTFKAHVHSAVKIDLVHTPGIGILYRRSKYTKMSLYDWLAGIAYKNKNMCYSTFETTSNSNIYLQQSDETLIYTTSLRYVHLIEGEVGGVILERGSGEAGVVTAHVQEEKIKWWQRFQRLHSSMYHIDLLQYAKERSNSYLQFADYSYGSDFWASTIEIFFDALPGIKPS